MANDGDETWTKLLESYELTSTERDVLNCKDPRQSGTCGCIQKFVVSQSSEIHMNARLNWLLETTRTAEQLKMVKSSPASSGQRYSPDYFNYVLATGQLLSDKKLCKKSSVRLLRCSLNFLYRPHPRPKQKQKSIEEWSNTTCCEKKCVPTLSLTNVFHIWRNKVEKGKSKDKREVFYDMKEHCIQPCDNAIKEITRLSKATINKLRTMNRQMGIPHKLEGVKKMPSNGPCLTIRTPRSVTPSPPHSTDVFKMEHGEKLSSFLAPRLSDDIGDESSQSDIDSPATLLTKRFEGLKYPPTSPQYSVDCFQNAPVFPSGYSSGFIPSYPITPTYFMNNFYPSSSRENSVQPENRELYPMERIHELGKQPICESGISQLSRARLPAFGDDPILRNTFDLSSDEKEIDVVNEHSLPNCDQHVISSPEYTNEYTAPTHKTELDVKKNEGKTKKRKMPELKPIDLAISRNIIIEGDGVSTNYLPIPELSRVRIELPDNMISKKKNHQFVETPTITAVTPSKVGNAIFNFQQFNNAKPTHSTNETLTQDRKVDPIMEPIVSGGSDSGFIEATISSNNYFPLKTKMAQNDIMCKFPQAPIPLETK